MIRHIFKIILIVSLCYSAGCGSNTTDLFIPDKPFIKNTCNIYKDKIKVVVLSYDNDPSLLDRINPFSSVYKSDPYDVRSKDSVDFEKKYIPYTVWIVGKDNKITVLSDSTQTIEMENGNINATLKYDYSFRTNDGSRILTVPVDYAYSFRPNGGSRMLTVPVKSVLIQD